MDEMSGIQDEHNLGGCCGLSVNLLACWLTGARQHCLRRMMDEPRRMT
jgi:hypothetical protein